MTVAVAQFIEPGLAAAAVCLAAAAAAVTALTAVSETDRKTARGLAAWEGLSDNISSGVVLTNAAAEYVYVNASAERMLQVSAENLLGCSVRDARHTLRVPLLIATDVLRHGKRPLLTGRFPMNGRIVVVEFSRAESSEGAFGGVAAVIRNMTEECEFCGNMIGTERMMVLGELAAAMAHEINSPLSGVMESVRIIRKNEGKWDKVSKFLPLVQQGLEQIAATVKQMLRFATPQEPVRTRLILEEVILKCADFIGYRQGETGARLSVNLGTECTPVVASAQCLSQVLINLINNAFDAVEGREGAAVEIRSKLLPASGEVMVQVVDNGPGVPPHLRARIFEPFFTTKPSGKGTGLGLSICARLSARKGGRIIVSDAPGGGAVFSLVLPVVGLINEEQDVSHR